MDDASSTFQSATIGVVGLGLMGGSIIKALKRHGCSDLIGIDANQHIFQQARQEGLLHNEQNQVTDLLKDATLIILCLTPSETVKFVQTNHGKFRSGSVITDICGIKTSMLDQIQKHLRKDVDYVPAHPMAGREKGGFDYSQETLFDGCNYIITPLQTNREASIDLVRQLAHALGSSNVFLSSPEQHDHMITYTSQIPHVLSVVYMKEAAGRQPKSFSAGSYKDVSRVASIDGKMWSELFISNRNYLVPEIQLLKEKLSEVEQLIQNGDQANLENYLTEAASIKKELG